MRVLVTGASGQLGIALKATKPTIIDAIFATRSEFDIGDFVQVRSFIAASLPDVIINTAAFTAVDKAESDEAAATLINAVAPRCIAEAVREHAGMRMIHVSTDFVFDGKSSRPYLPTHDMAPLCAYGRSKAAGEAAVSQVLSERVIVVRTAWLYSASGHNFVKTMLRLMQERDEVAVVDDQIGTPTSAHSLADVLWRFASRVDLSGTFHWTDAGVASWYDFAVAIAEEALAAGILHSSNTVKAIPTSRYPTPARRPSYSVLDKRATLAALGIENLHWRRNLRRVIGELSRA